MATIPNLKTPVRLHIKTRTVNDEGDMVESLLLLNTAFAQFDYKPTNETNLNAPRQVIRVTAIIRELSSMIYAFSPEDYRIEASGKMYAVAQAIPLGNGYLKLELYGV